MIKWIVMILALLCMPMSAAAQEETAMTIIHATDTHFISPELTDHGAYFTRMVESGDGKVMMYSEELMEAFVEQMIEQAPDAVILSGDLTFNGAYKSHVDLARKLACIEAAGIAVYVIPGNHDIDCSSAARFEGEGYVRVSPTDKEQFAQLYAAFGYDEALSRDPYSLSYTAALSTDLRLLMVDVNAVDAPGTVMSETIAWAREQLRDAQESGADVIAVSHQNLLVHSPLFTSGFAMENNDRLLALYEAYGVKLNLSGHMHMQHMAQSEGGVLDIATSALCVLACQYGVMEIEDGQLVYRTESVDVSAWAKRHGMPDENLLTFEQYARDFFLDTGRSQGTSSFGDGEQAQTVSQGLALLNAAYFSGRLDETGLSEEAVAQLEGLDGFWGLYVRSITAEGAVNHTQRTLAL